MSKYDDMAKKLSKQVKDGTATIEELENFIDEVKFRYNLEELEDALVELERKHLKTKGIIF